MQGIVFPGMLASIPKETGLRTEKLLERRGRKLKVGLRRASVPMAFGMLSGVMKISMLRNFNVF